MADSKEQTERTGRQRGERLGGFQCTQGMSRPRGFMPLLNSAPGEPWAKEWKKWQTDPFKDLPPAEKEQKISIQISFLAHLSYVGCSLVLIAHMMFTMYFTLTQSQP